MAAGKPVVLIGTSADGRRAGCVIHSGVAGVVTVAFYRLEEGRVLLAEVRAYRTAKPRVDVATAQALLGAWVCPAGIEPLNAAQARSGPLGEMTARMLELVEGVDIPDEDRIPFLHVEDAELIVESADPGDFGFRNVRDLWAHLMYVVAAGQYIDTRSGSMSDLAGKLGVDTQEATALVARARRHGYLSSAGSGRKGGVVTDKWIALAERCHEWLEDLEGDKQ